MRKRNHRPHVQRIGELHVPRRDTLTHHKTRLLGVDVEDVPLRQDFPQRLKIRSLSSLRGDYEDTRIGDVIGLLFKQPLHCAGLECSHLRPQRTSVRDLTQIRDVLPLEVLDLELACWLALQDRLARLRLHELHDFSHYSPPFSSLRMVASAATLVMLRSVYR